MIYSNDWGSNWISEEDAIVLEDQISFDPVISQDGRFLSSVVMNGSSYNLVLRDITHIDLNIIVDDGGGSVPCPEVRVIPSYGVYGIFFSMAITSIFALRKRKKLE